MDLASIQNAAEIERKARELIVPNIEIPVNQFKDTPSPFGSSFGPIPAPDNYCKYTCPYDKTTFMGVSDLPLIEWLSHMIGCHKWKGLRNINGSHYCIVPGFEAYKFNK